MQFEQITIVGVGLIGGSVGLAAKAHGAARRVVGVDRSADAVAKAVQVGAVDDGTTDLAAGVRGSQLVVVCTPVDRIAEAVIEAARHADPNTLFTDGGSTKGRIVEAVRGQRPAGVGYVAAHPLAGSEKAGCEHGRADLFVGRTTVVIVDKFVADWDRTAKVGRFWELLGSRVVLMNAEEHDRTVAFTSHLPHAVASAVAGVTPADWLHLTAGGFRDVTRIAAGDPNLWAAIFEANRDATLHALASLAQRLGAFRTILEGGDRAALVQWLLEGKQVRDALGT